MRYLDTSSLVALYFPEGKSETLLAYLLRHPLPLAFTWLHEIEFTNAMELKIFRKEATNITTAATLKALHADLDKGVLHRSQPSWSVVFSSAIRLSSDHSRTLGTRTLDLLHVSAALTMQVTEFVTGDDRQAKVAVKEGMKVVRI